MTEPTNIADAITAAQGRVAACYTSVDTMGGTLPETQNLANLPDAIESIPTGASYNGLSNSFSKGYLTVDKGAFENYTVTDGEVGCLGHVKTFCHDFQITGTPTINFSTGAVSGFSSSNYLVLPEAFNPQSNTWENIIKFTTGNNVSSAQYLFQSSRGTGGGANRYGILMFIESGVFKFNTTYTGSAWGLGNASGSYAIQTNTTYWIKFGWNGTEYYVDYSLDGETYTRDITFTSTTETYSSLAYSCLGIYASDSYVNPFLGTIELSECVFKIGDKVFWSGKSNDCLVKTERYSNYTKVGSINADVNTGLIDNFSSSNYLLMPKAFPDNVDYADIIFRGLLTDVTNSHSMILEYNGSYSFCIRANTSKFSCYAGAWIDGTNTLSTNTWYWFRITFDGTNWTGYTQDGSSPINVSAWRQEWTTTASIPFSDNLWEIGTNANSRGQYFHGMLDLSQSKMSIGYAVSGNDGFIDLNWWTAKGDYFDFTKGMLKSGETFGTPLYIYGKDNSVVLSKNDISGYSYGGQANITGYSDYPVYDLSPSWGFVGSPVYDGTDMTYSGFSSSSYLVSDYVFEMTTAQFAKGFTLQVHIKTPSSFPSNDMHLIYCGSDYTHGPYIGIRSGGKCAYCGLSSGGSQIFEISETATQLSTNTEYWLRMTKPDTTYFSHDTVLQLSTDGETWTDLGSSSSAPSTTLTADRMLRVGYAGNVFTGKVYLEDTFIEIDGEKVWDMVK